MNLLRSVVRPLLTRPGLTVTIVLTLALGIGLDTALFTVLDAALLQRLPYRDPERLVEVEQLQLDRGGRHVGFSWPGLLELRAQPELFSAVAAQNQRTQAVRVGERTEMLPTAEVTADFLEVLGVRPSLGRGFLPGEEGPGAPRLALVTSAFWRDRLGSAPDVVGSTVVLDGQPTTVVGVLGPEFRWPIAEVAPTPGYGVPQLLVTMRPEDDLATRRNGIWLGVVARLRPGVGMETVRARLDALAARLRSDFPVDQRNVGMTATPLREAQVGSLRPVLLVLWGAVGLLLLLTCANVANLLLVRAVSREHEMAVRSALGADRARLVRALFAEALVLALLGACLGWALARVTVPGLAAAIPSAQRAALPFLSDLRPDATALVYAVALAVVTSLLFGVVPALRLSRVNLAGAMKDSSLRSGTPGRHRAMQVLVLAQIALAVVLLHGAGLFAKSLSAILSTDPGFRPLGTYAGALALPRRTLSDDETRRLLERAVATVERLPGVREAAVTTHLPGTSDTGRMGVRAAGTTDPGALATMRIVTPGYFDTLGVPILRGRGFGPDDGPAAPAVAVVNEAFARSYFPHGDALGRRFQLTYRPDGEVMTVVGVVRDERLGRLDAPPPPAFYLPWSQNPSGRGVLALVVRSGREGTALARELRDAASSVDADLVVQSVRALPAILDDSPAVFQRRYPVWMLAVFSAVATLLAAVGLFGVLSYVVGERAHELGIRMALGADRRSILRDVARRAAPPVVAGSLLGLLAAWISGAALRGVLTGARTFEPGVLAAVLLGILATSLLATLVPARRALRTDPASSLRAP